MNLCSQVCLRWFGYLRALRICTNFQHSVQVFVYDHQQRHEQLEQQQQQTQKEAEKAKDCAQSGATSVSYTHLTLPTNREV